MLKPSLRSTLFRSSGFLLLPILLGAGILKWTSPVFLNPSIYNAGKVKPGETFHCVMHITNFTWSTVKVSTVPTCGCITTTLTRSPLGPFRTISIGADVHSPTHTTGLLTKTLLVYVETPSGEMSRRTMTINLDVEKNSGTDLSRISKA